MPQTLEQIRREGLEALRERLGRVGMIRFLQQFESGSGDYPKQRHAWVDATTMDDLTADLNALRKKKSRSSRRKSQ